MKKKLTFLCAVSALLVTAIFFVCNTASADVITVSDVYQILSNNTPTDTGHKAGATVWIGAMDVVPNGNNGTTGWIGSPFIPKMAQLAFIPTTLAPNMFHGEGPSSMVLSWVLSFENGTDTKTVWTPGCIAPLVPIVDNVAILGSGSAPTFTWTNYPGFMPDVLMVRIWDLEKTVNYTYQAKDVIYTQTLGNTDSMFTVPSSWTLPSGATMSLQQNHQYDIDIRALITRTDASGNKPTIVDLPQVLSQSVSSFDFRILPSGAPPKVYLPTTTPATGSSPLVYTFHTTVVAGETIFVDPLVAIGYDYQIGAGDPNFASVTLPIGIGDNLFDLWLYDGTNYYFKDHLTGGINYMFDDGGVDRFRILGIETSAGLDPNDDTAFITGLTFTADGVFDGTMIPITQNVPEPSTILLLGLGLIGLMGLRRKFKQ